MKNNSQGSRDALDHAVQAFDQLIEQIAQQALERSQELPSLAEARQLVSDAVRRIYEARERHFGKHAKHTADDNG